MRVFCSHAGRHHSTTEYSHGSTPANELQVIENPFSDELHRFKPSSERFIIISQIYTWMDASLKEITSLIRDVNPATKRNGEKGEAQR